MRLPYGTSIRQYIDYVDCEIGRRLIISIYSVYLVILVSVGTNWHPVLASGSGTTRIQC